MVPQALRDRHQWLVWRLEKKPGVDKPAKMPYYCNGARRTGTQGSDEDRAKLTTFDFALEVKTRGKYDGIGFAFLPDDGLIGIDLDNAFEWETDQSSGEMKRGAPTERMGKIIAACASFTEYSPSGKGVHIYALGKTESFKSNDIGVEVFCGRQFFTVTGEQVPGTPDRANDLDVSVLNRLRVTVDKAKGKGAAARPVPAAAANIDARAKVESALAVLSPDAGYEEWLSMGMAIHAELGDGGFAVWDYWSSKSAKYPGPKVIESHWKSFRAGGGITGATLFKRAVESGWRAPKGARGPRGSRGKSFSGGGDSPPPNGGAPPPDEPGDGLPIITVTAGELPATVDAAEAALIASNVQIYQRDRMLVRVMRRSVPSVRNYKRPAGTLGIVPVELPFLVETLTRVARWERWDPRSQTPVRINAPDKVAATYMARAGQWKLPELWSVITAPTLRPDGTILQKPGYDAAMKTWYDPCGVKFPLIPDKPSRDDAVEALTLLKKAFSTFPWGSPVDESVALALALCSLVRRSLTSAPLGGITAPVARSGKTLLADAIAILATGSSAPTMTYTDNEEEFKKTLLAVLMEGDPVVMIDNVQAPLQGDTLCSILTTETYSQRMLGRTEMVKVQTTVQILATGNQLVVAGDLPPRTLLCRIDPKSEHPEEREFAVVLRDWFLNHRPQLVAAALTLMRAFVVSGKKNTVKPLGGFEHWSDMVRAPLVWLGEPDPCASIKELQNDDPDRSALRQVLHAWRGLYGSDSKKSSEVCKTMTEVTAFGTDAERALEESLREWVRDRDGAWSPRRLSKWLTKHAGRRMDDLMITKGEEQDHTQRWRVDEVPELQG